MWAPPLPAVAVASGTVYVEGVAAGEATVTVTTTDGSKTATCKVTVQAETVSVTGVTLSSTDVTLTPNGTVTLSVDVAPANATNKDVTWSVTQAEGYVELYSGTTKLGNSVVLSHDKPVIVKGVKAGTATITATAGEKSGTCKVTVEEPTYNVTVTAGTGMTKTESSGEAAQTGLTGAMTAVVYTANEGYYFPEGYSVATVNGVGVTRDSATQITVSGTPEAEDVQIKLKDATEKTKPAAPTASATDCTTTANDDGKITGVTEAMEYTKSDAESWTDVTGNVITGLVPGTYSIRVKATDTALASDPQTLTINPKTSGDDTGGGKDKDDNNNPGGGSSGDSDKDNNPGGEDSGGVTPDEPEKSASEKAAESLTSRLDLSSETVRSLITALFGNVKIVMLSTDVATLSGDRSPEELSADQLKELSNDHSVILAVLPEITPKVTAVFVLGVSFDITPEGTLKWHGFPKAAENKVALAADEEECLFLNDAGEEITTAPANGHVNAAVKLTKDVTYAPVITAETASGGENTPTGPTSSKGSGGCDAGLGLVGLLAATGLIARRKK